LVKTSQGDCPLLTHLHTVASQIKPRDAIQFYLEDKKIQILTGASLITPIKFPNGRDAFYLTDLITDENSCFVIAAFIAALISLRIETAEHTVHGPRYTFIAME
jgi:hypothetical protein